MQKALRLSLATSLAGSALTGGLLMVSLFVNFAAFELISLTCVAMLFLTSAIVGVGCCFPKLWLNQTRGESATSNDEQRWPIRSKRWLRVSWAISIPVIGLIALGAEFCQAFLLTALCSSAFYLTIGVFIASFFSRAARPQKP